MQQNCKWSSLCSLKAGTGSVILLEPTDLTALKEAVTSFSGLILGRGTNLCGSDAENPLPCLRLGSGGDFSVFRHLDNGLFQVGCALPLGQALAMAAREGYGGAAGLSGIPGTLGGALAMNAGANGIEIAAFTEEMHGVELGSGKLWTWSKKDGGWNYRTSPIPADVIVYDALIQLQPVSAEAELHLQEEERKRRIRVTPAGASAGSVFRNPPGNPPAGVLLEQAGCKGLTCGVYSVSKEHANWIVNLSRQPGSSVDCRNLALEMRRRVQDMFHISLQCELRWADALRHEN